MERYLINESQVERRKLKIIYTKELGYSRKSAYNQSNALRAKHKYQFMIKLKVIEYKEKFLNYFSFYISLLTGLYFIIPMIALLIVLAWLSITIGLFLLKPPLCRLTYLLSQAIIMLSLYFYLLDLLVYYLNSKYIQIKN